MTEQLDTSSEALPAATNVSRRNLLLGAGAIAGAAAGAGLLTNPASAASAPKRITLPTVSPRPEVLGAAIPGLTYVSIDAQQFFGSGNEGRIYQDITGTQPFTYPGRIWAGLHLPAGSVVYQLNVGYQGQPIAEISKRLVTQPNPATPPTQVFQKTLLAGPGGPFSSTENLATPVTIEANASYNVSFFCSTGQSVFNVTIGYLPPTQSFVPLPAAVTPRIFDSRGGPKFAINEEKTVDLGIPGARTAIINLTVTETVGAGFVAVFPADVTYPGNSSINWSGPNQDIANGVIVRVDSAGKIKVRASNSTHVVIDRIGYMI